MRFDFENKQEAENWFYVVSYFLAHTYRMEDEFSPILDAYAEEVGEGVATEAYIKARPRLEDRVNELTYLAIANKVKGWKLFQLIRAIATIEQAYYTMISVHFQGVEGHDLKWEFEYLYDEAAMMYSGDRYLSCPREGAIEHLENCITEELRLTSESDIHNSESSPTLLKRFKESLDSMTDEELIKAFESAGALEIRHPEEFGYKLTPNFEGCDISEVMDKYLKTVELMTDKELLEALVKSGVEKIAQTEEICEKIFNGEG